MAGDFPVPAKSSGRKQWALYNGSQRYGRSHLAEDGCPESQVVLAKQLLDEKTDLEIDQEENARLGVYWLIKASKQGHEEATSILRHCLETGQGITEHNYLDVKACLAMSHEEKVARRAAKQLFTSMSGGDDFITTDQLQDCMKRSINSDLMVGKTDVGSASTASISQDWKSRPECGVEKVTEEMLVAAASSYSKGELPIVHRAVLHVETANEDRCVRESCFYLISPVLAITSSYHHIIDIISQQNIRNLLSLILKNIQAVIFVWIIMQFDFYEVVSIVPTLIYFFSFITMIISTCQALSKNNDFQHFRRWSNLFLQYSGGNLNANEAEYQHCYNNLKPYSVFFISLLVHLILTPFMMQTSSSQSEITAVAFIFSFVTLYKFTTSTLSSTSVRSDGTKNKNGNENIVGVSRTSSLDVLGLFSFAVHVLARYPYETDVVVSYGWRFLDVHVPTFASYIVGNGVEFCLNFRALFYLIIPAVLIKMASRENWRGTYTSLVPHCMSLAWWQITVLSSQGATWYGLIRSALALVGLVLFLPLTGLATVLVPLVAAGKFLFEFKDQSQLITAVFIATIPLSFAYIISRQKKFGSFKWSLVLNVVQILLIVLSAAVLMLSSSKLSNFSRGVHKSLPSLSITNDGQNEVVEEDDSLSYITWPQFNQICTSPFECSQLSGLPVKWEGRVSTTRLVKIYNPVAQITQRLPHTLQTAIKCWYGEKFTSIADENNDNNDIPSPLLGECHLSNWDRYEFEIDVTMNSGLWRTSESSVTLVGLDNVFKNMTNSLRFGDNIWFFGSLVSNSAGMINRDSPRIETNKLGCLICKNNAINNVVVKKGQIFSISSFYSGMKTILNFLFNPLVVFR